MTLLYADHGFWADGGSSCDHVDGLSRDLSALRRGANRIAAALGIDRSQVSRTLRVSPAAGTATAATRRGQ